MHTYALRPSFVVRWVVTAFSIGSLQACGDSAGGGAPSVDAGGTQATDGGAGGGDGSAPPSPPGDGGAGGKTFDAGSEPSRNTITADGLCDRFATLQCAAEQSCCSEPGRTFDACKATQLAICRDQGYLDKAAQEPVSGFSSDNARAAFERFETLARTCDTDITTWVLAVKDGFRGVFAGTLAPGASCLPPVDSLSDLGKASAYGLACTGPETTSCLPKTALNWTCDPRGGEGSPCFTDANCTGPVYCTNTEANLNGIGKGTCAARKPVGEACNGSGECQSLVCVAKQCAPLSVDGAYCLGR